MKDEFVQITLINTESNTKVKEKEVDGKTYFLAAVGKEFKVKVKLDNTCGLYPRDGCVRVFLSIDGEDVGSHVFKQPSLKRKSSIHEFEGFQDAFEIKAFVFKGQPFTEDEISFDPKVGYIGVEIWIVNMEYKLPTNRGCPGPLKETEFKVRSYKSQWDQASACVGMGRVLETLEKPTEEDLTRARIHYTCQEFLKEVIVPYHTLDTLKNFEASLRYDGTGSPPQSTAMGPVAQNAVNLATAGVSSLGKVNKSQVQQVGNKLYMTIEMTTGGKRKASSSSSEPSGKHTNTRDVVDREDCDNDGDDEGVVEEVELAPRKIDVVDLCD